jgi:hypothetical protein
MNRPISNLLYWTPRILGILFALFISLFAMDVFNEGYTLPDLLIALLMHMIPTAMVVIALVIAWRWEWVGAVLFIGLGIFYIVWAWGSFHISAYLGISGPLIVTGMLFLINWLLRGKLRHSRKPVPSLSS